MAHAQKPDLVLQRNGRVHLNWPGGGGAVKSPPGSQGLRISGSNGSNAGYTMFWGRVQDYWLPTPLACFPFTSPTLRHRVPSHFNWALLYDRGLTVSSASVRPSQRTQSVSVIKTNPRSCYPISLIRNVAGRLIQGDSGEKNLHFRRR